MKTTEKPCHVCGGNPAETHVKQAHICDTCMDRIDRLAEMQAGADDLFG